MSKQLEKSYGAHAITAFLEAHPKAARMLYVQLGKQNKRLDAIIAKAKALQLSIETIDRSQMDQLCFAQKHQGCVLMHTGIQTSGSLESIVQRHGDSTRILILAHVQDPHNLGACLRTACAAGMHAVILTKHDSCVVNETVVKVASGAASHLNIFTVTNLSQTLAKLKSLGVWVYGTSEHAADSLYDVARGQHAMAVVMGGEGPGLRKQLQQHCDYLLQIPTAKSMRSLNISVATGVVLFELFHNAL